MEFYIQKSSTDFYDILPNSLFTPFATLHKSAGERI